MSLNIPKRVGRPEIRVARRTAEDERFWHGMIYKPDLDIELRTDERPFRILARPFHGQLKPKKDVWLDYFGVELR